MADIRLLVTTAFDNSQLKEGVEEVKSTFQDLNNSTLNTTNRQINEIQGQIGY